MDSHHTSLFLEPLQLLQGFHELSTLQMGKLGVRRERGKEKEKREEKERKRREKEKTT